MEDPIQIKRALLSCWDKSGLEDFARHLVQMGVTIISSGGTAKTLRDAGIKVTPVEEITGFPPMLDGRVKTLHPFIHGAILARRTEDHLSQLRQQGIQPIDLVVVNLYPFLDVVEKGEHSEAEMVEFIDIGGPAMLRAAAKNFEWVTVLHSPAQYEEFLEVIRQNQGHIPFARRKKWAADTFFYSAYYDSRVATYLADQDLDSPLPEKITHFYQKKQNLRYGENPHQAAALYEEFGTSRAGEYRLRQLGGKEMSFNNYVDVQAAADLVGEFEETVAAIIKHTNPCGAAVGAQPAEAFERALASDSVSAFGGIIALNKPLDVPTAKRIVSSFYECVVAPEYEEQAIDILKQKKNLRILQMPMGEESGKTLDYKFLQIGLLAQEPDALDDRKIDWSIPANRQPTTEEKEDLLFAWKIVKHVKSNAIVFVKNKQLLGVGAGQMSRVDSVKIARMKAEQAGHNLSGAVMASDAFFPFRDGVDEAAAAGITAIIQPGGSIRDNEVIDAVNEQGMAMVFTGVRHFKH